MILDDHRNQLATSDQAFDTSTRLAARSLTGTRTCNKLRSVNWLTGGGDLTVALDRGRLAKIDGKVFAELDHADGVQAVKVPVSDAVWSTWRRYCETMGLSMGGGVAGLILDELKTVIGTDGNDTPAFAVQISRQAEERGTQLDARENELDAQAGILARKEAHLRDWERRLRTTRTAGDQTRSNAKVGRNERCPCRSGLKYKHCHGLPRRSG